MAIGWPSAERYLEVRATPGHTDGCVTYVTRRPQHGVHRRLSADPRRRPLRFPAGQCQHAVPLDHRADLQLPDSCLIFPGHDYSGRTMSSVGEEQRTIRASAAQADERDFVSFMESLNLPPSQAD